MNNTDKAAKTDHGALLKKQLEELAAIQEKALNLDRESPDREVMEALYLELGEALQELSDLHAVQQDLEHQVEENEVLRKDLEIRQDQLERLAVEKERLEGDKEHLGSLLTYRDFENVKLRNDLSRLTDWLKELQENFQAIMNSRRWLLGSAVVGLPNRLLRRPNRHPEAERMGQLFSQFQSWSKKAKKSALKEDDPGALQRDIKQLTRWLNQLQKYMERLLQSRKMKTGNFIARVLLAPLGRGKTPAQVKNINAIFSAYRAWPGGNSRQDLKQLRRWIKELKRNYKALLKSRRWKIGDRLVSFLYLLTFRKPQNLTVKAINDIFANFKEWQQARDAGR